MAAFLPYRHTEQSNGRLLVICAGKASARMAQAVEASYGPREGLMITRYGYGRPCKGSRRPSLFPMRMV